MHIPDGYLSPSTCLVLYGATAPFWVLAYRRLKAALSARLVPLLSLFSAFSFVVMMFNIPLPGGTTGHAVGAAVAAIVLGPWTGILATSVALLVQALFFADGGITTLAANCFNMAVAGSLAASWVYRWVAGRSDLTAPRRVLAAGLAGYFSLNLAALLTAVEFGLQPLLFRAADGTPLYAPYPLQIAVPAMMVGHLLFAGFVEAVFTGGLVAWIQRTDPALLQATAPGAAVGQIPAQRQVSLRPLWIGLALLMIVSPLGLLAAGTAWGEWAPEDFANPGVRAEIAAASLGTPPPTAPPAGLARLATIWTAPIPDYAPPFLKSAGFGYGMSALLGGGVILLAFQLLVGRRHRLETKPDPGPKR